MSPSIFLISVLVVTVALLIRAEILGKQGQIYIFKPISTILVIGVALLSFLEPGWNPTYTVGVTVGLLLSLGGDIALMFPENRRAFGIGLGLFLLAHIAYAVVFTLLGGFSAWDLLSAVILLVLGVGFYRLVRPNLGALQGPVIVYIVVISVMVNRGRGDGGKPRVWGNPGCDDSDGSAPVLHLGYHAGREPLLETMEIQSHQSGVLLRRSTPYCPCRRLFRVREERGERARRTGRQGEIPPIGTMESIPGFQDDALTVKSLDNTSSWS